MERPSLSRRRITHLVFASRSAASFKNESADGGSSSSRAKQVAEEFDSERGGGFNPSIHLEEPLGVPHFTPISFCMGTPGSRSAMPSKDHICIRGRKKPITSSPFQALRSGSRRKQICDSPSPSRPSNQSTPHSLIVFAVCHPSRLPWEMYPQAQARRCRCVPPMRERIHSLSIPALEERGSHRGRPPI